MRKYYFSLKIRLFLFSLLSILLVQCDKSTDVAPTPVNAEVASNVVLDDVTNNGDGSDLLVTFSKAADETTVSEYRILIVNTQTTSFLTRNMANNVTSFTTVQKTGDDLEVSLSSSTTDIDDVVIKNNQSYKAYVLSIADGTHAIENSLAIGSNIMRIAFTRIKITYLQNEGVMISDGESMVLIDALFTNSTGWIGMSSANQADLINARSQYNNANVVLTTHNHGDHFNPSSVNSYLSNSSSTRFIGTSQITGSISNQSQIENITPELGESITKTVNGIEITVINITHFNPIDGTNFSNVENYAYLIRIGGFKILHLGDGDLKASNFENYNLNNLGINVALIPTFIFSGQLSSTNRQVLLDFIKPLNVIGLHLFNGTTKEQVQAIHPTAVVFNKSLQFVRF